jgi:hypothetical protein
MTSFYVVLWIAAGSAPTSDFDSNWQKIALNDLEDGLQFLFLSTDE